MDLRAAAGQELRPGVFDNIHNGIACAEVSARFTIERHEHGEGAVVHAFDGTLEQRCGSPDALPLTVRISYRQPAG